MTLLFFSFFICNFAQASLVKKAFDLPYLKKITDMVVSKQQMGHSHFELTRLIHTANHIPFQSKVHDHDCQCACMYILLAEEKRNQQTGVYAYQKKAVSYLAMHPIKSLERPYIIAAERVAKDDKPWEKNWAPQYDFLRKF
jgi:hypothetical protein